MKHITAHALCMLDNQGYNIHSEYVKVNAFPLQQWMYEGARMLRCTYIASLIQYAKRV